MKLLTEYLDRALSLERLAAGERDSAFKAQLLNQAAAYRKLAASERKIMGCPLPGRPTKQWLSLKTVSAHYCNVA